MIHTEPTLPSAYDHKSADLRARARRAEFLDRHELKAFDSSSENVVRMIREMQADLTSGRIHPRFSTPKDAITALARLVSRHGPSGVRTLGREYFDSGFSLYGFRTRTLPCLMTCHSDALTPGEIRELDDYRLAGFDIRLQGEGWIARTGIRIMISNPVDLKLTPEPEPDPDLLPGPSNSPRHVRLRASAGGSTRHIPIPEINS